MAFIFSPSVNVIERVLNTSVPALPTSITGMVGEFAWGPCNQIVDITNDKELTDIFYQPDDTNYASFFSAWRYLQYATNLKIVRVITEATADNAGLEINDATATGTNTKSDLILNDEDADSYTPSFGADAKMQVFAKYPGAYGNSITVAVANYADFATANIDTGITFIDNFDYAPQDANDFAIAVLYNGEIVEKFIASFDTASTDYEGSNNYAPTYINRRSDYILVYDNSSNSDSVDSIEATSLTGGTASTPGSSEIEAGFELFNNSENVTVNMMIDGGWNNETIQQYVIDNIAESRKDMVFYCTCPKDNVVGVANVSTAVSNLVTYRSTTLARSSSYAALYGNWAYMYDQYNDKYRWVPLSGDIAGITALTHYNRDPWFAPMGYNRGILKNVSKLAFYPNRTHRDTLYRNFINPITNDSDVGPVVLGQKTLISTPSSFSRLDVRWLFITIEQAIAAAAKYFIGEKNTTFTQRQFKGVVEPYLRDVQGRGGIEPDESGGDGFYVQVDSVVNTPVVKDRNEFHANIYIRPTQTAEFIILEFNNVNGSISFEEVIKKSTA